LDGKELQFSCTRMGHEVKDSVRCDFTFEAKWKPSPDGPHKFKFQESNFNLEPGMLRLSLGSGTRVLFDEKSEPDEALKKKLPADLRPGDDYRLRKATAVFRVVPESLPEMASFAVLAAATPNPAPGLSLLLALEHVQNEWDLRTSRVAATQA